VPPEAATLLELYRELVLLRRFEERVYLLFLDGEIPGTLHQYQGQEAVAVGAARWSEPTGSRRHTGRTATRSPRA
jgi:TPP-dependent pyruvate/acetoin dehydrogenase alpha subunit